MKKGIKLALAAVLAISLLLCGACNKAMPKDTTGEATQAQEKTIVGIWAIPKTEWFNKTMPEYWEFSADGKYVNYQTNENGVVYNKQDGSYTVDGETLSLIYGGFGPLTYTFKLTDANTMVCSDHETEATLTRFTGTLTNK